MATKRIYVTPKDITLGGVWNGTGKDPISRAMTRALGQRVICGVTIFCLGQGKECRVLKLPVRVTEEYVRVTERGESMARFNFRVEV